MLECSKKEKAPRKGGLFAGRWSGRLSASNEAEHSEEQFQEEHHDSKNQGDAEENLNDLGKKSFHVNLRQLQLVK